MYILTLCMLTTPAVFVTDVVLQELLSLLMQELWLERPIPHQFLSYVLSQRDSGYPVVDSLMQSLGGTKIITKWIQKDGV